MDISTITGAVDPLVLAVTVAGTVGAVQLVKEILNAIQNFKELGIGALQSPLIIVVAAAIGALITALMGANPLFGVVIGLSATGLYKLTKNVG